MENFNLPPFYVGQKVVYLGPSNNGYFNNKEYFVKGIKAACNHSQSSHIVSVGILVPCGCTNYCETCGFDNSMSGSIGLMSSLFRPVQESKFHAVTFEKILKETPEICVN